MMRPWKSVFPDTGDFRLILPLRYGLMTILKNNQGLAPNKAQSTMSVAPWSGVILSARDQAKSKTGQVLKL